MALKWQNIRVPFGGGIDTKTDEKQVVPGKLLTLENGVFHETGAIRKRNGFETPCSFDTDGNDTMSSGTSIHSRDQEMIITGLRTNLGTGRVNRLDGRKVFSYGADNDRWYTIGEREPLRVAVDSVASPEYYSTIPDVALAGDGAYICYAWLMVGHVTQDGSVCYTVRETENDNVCIDHNVLSPAAGNDYEGVHVVGYNNDTPVFQVWYADPGNNVARAIVLECDGFTTGLSAAIADLHGDMVWDVCKATHSTEGECTVVAYKESAAGQVNVSWFREDGTLIQTRNIPTVIKNAITVYEEYDHLTSSNKVLVAYQENATDDIRGATYNDDTTTYVATNYLIHNLVDTDIRQITGCKDAATDNDGGLVGSFLRLYYEVGLDATGWAHWASTVYESVYEFDGTNPALVRRDWHAALASKAFAHESKARVWTVFDSGGKLNDTDWSNTTQNTYFLISDGVQNLSYRSTDARCLAGAAGGVNPFQHLSAVVEMGDGQYQFAGRKHATIVRPNVNDNPNVILDAIVGIGVEFDVCALPSCNCGPTLQTGGGYIGDADGMHQELGFHLYPIITSHVASGGTSGTPAVWQYRAVYEWMDREGQRHQSAPSMPYTVEATDDDDHVVLQVMTLANGDLAKLASTASSYSELQIALYRTENGGTVFYRVYSLAYPAWNNPIAHAVSVYDRPPAGTAATPDATLRQYETLYTTGGVLENICPPASAIMCEYQDRVLVVPDEDRTSIWYSKLKRHGVGLSFTDYFTLRITDGGDITAMETMDSRVVVFKENQIRAFSGDGPNDLGIGGFSNDYMVTSDVGCVDRASVVWTDKGLMFKSHKGIYLLGRNLQVSYIGAPVEDFNQFSVLKATLVETKNQVRFLLDGSQMLVYDYLVDQWSVFKSPQTDPEVETYWDTVDSAMWQGRYAMIQDDGTVHVEGTDYTDGTDDHYIPLTIETAWIKLTGLQGYQRVRWAHFLGEICGQCGLTIEMYRDYIETAIQTATITVDATFAGAGGEHQVRVKPVFQKGEAYKFRIYDAEDETWGGTQEGYAVSEIMLEVGLKKGLHKLSTLKTR